MITDETKPEAAPAAQKVKTEYVSQFLKVLTIRPCTIANLALYLFIIDLTSNWSLSTPRFGETSKFASQIATF